MSLSSHKVAKGSGESSELGWIDTRAGAHHAPAALGLGFAEGGAHLRQRVGHAAGVRHLIEAVRRRYGADPHRLEQDIEARIARHGGSLDLMRRLECAQSN